jgi:hypothetical protein
MDVKWRWPSGYLRPGHVNLGLMILYDQVNQQPDMLAERVFSPWQDMEGSCARKPFVFLESKRPVLSSICWGSASYERLYQRVNLLDLAGCPSAARGTPAFRW